MFLRSANAISVFLIFRVFSQLLSVRADVVFFQIIFYLFFGLRQVAQGKDRDESLNLAHGQIPLSQFFQKRNQLLVESHSEDFRGIADGHGVG